ncbi:MAG: toll/interleukin-1 receptor domain-containing protein [Hyphomonadaceae bacterium]|nr:toll/interleukin-1 receptor domain-containing protein [Hyphomonadaceae bacterium]
MADIFISYKKEDAGRVVRIVEGLRAEGFTVWWDHGIAPGNQWDQTIQRELDASKVVVAVWSEDSVSAPWVKEEAGVGKSRGALVPVRIDDVNPPLGFGLIQFADLIDWDGDIEDGHWDFFIESIRAVMDGKPIAGLEKPARKRRMSFVPIVAVLGLAVLGVGGILAWNMLSSVDSVSYDRANSDGTVTTSTISRSTAPSEPGEAEEAMFLKAQGSALKTDYQDVLRSFPQGYYARRIREEIFPLCRNEQREIWARQQTGQMLRGVTTLENAAGEAITYASADEACASAKSNVEYDANRYCNGFTASADARNPEVAMTWVDCVCEEAGGSWWCLVDPTYSCVWEYKSFEFVEVCG